MGKQVPHECIVGYAKGLNRGFVVTKRVVAARPVNVRRGSQRTRAINQLMKSICGLSPYEKRVMEYYKVGEAKLDKRASKFLRKRLGSITRAKRKEAYIRLIIKDQKDARRKQEAEVAAEAKA